MLHQEFEPPEELRHTIKCFWYNRKDFPAEESAFEVVPDGYAEIIFHFGNGCSIAYNGGLLPSPFLIGLLGQPALFYTKNRFEVIGIRCYPWTVFDLLGLQPGKDRLRILDHPIASLQPTLNKLIDGGEIEEAVAVVKQYFLDAHTAAGDRMLLKAGAAMTQANGTMPVSRVAAEAHTTIRTLERKFKQSSGYSVKDVSGLMRFEQVRNRLWWHPESKLAGLALEFGYTDQSHLSREFKRYSGTTPAAFAKRGKKEKQAITDFVAFVQA
jgi:AraC-like DNA-binding protein